MQRIIEQLTQASQLSKSALAARSGLARSTPFRIQNGQVDPTIGSLRELSLAGGYDLEIALVPLSDPDAARAARAMLDPIFQATYDSNSRIRGVEEWMQRLRRWVPDGDPMEIVRQAGTSASLLHRVGAGFLRGQVTELKLASAGSFSDQEWFLSGAPVIDRIDEPLDEPLDDGRTVPGGEPTPAAESAGSAPRPYVVYCSDPRRFTRLLDNMERVRPEKANLIVADYTEGVEVDSWQEENITLVAPIQGLIDAFGIGGTLGFAAERIARSW